MVAITHFFDRGWRHSPDALAYVKGGQTWTFESAGRLSCAIANRLLDSGLPPGTKVGVLSPNDPVAWLTVLGLWRAGMVWLPLNPASPPVALAELITAFDGEALFVHSSLAEAVSELQHLCPGLRLIVGVDAAVGEAPSLETWTAGMSTSPPDVPYDPDAVIAIFPTGGTTGRSKGVMNTHRTFAASFAHMMMALEYAPDERIVNLVAAPLTHTAGMLSLPATARGGTVVVIERAEPQAVLKAIERHAVTELFLPPTVIYRLLETPGLDECDTSSLRYLLYGAAPMSADKLTRALEILGPVMTEVYGQVEAFAAISFMKPSEHYVEGRVREDARLTSCGRPYPLIRIEIRDGAREVPVGESGEICVHGDLVMRGYYGQPEETARAIRDGWLYTGDIGHVDHDGYLYITDRVKDVIITGGLNVYPSDVERVLWGHPSVQDCAVIGIPDDDWGEQVIAVVEAAPSSAVDTDALIALCKAHLGSYRAPKRIDVIAELPRSVNGKVLKKDLRAAYWQGHGRRI